MKTFVCAATFLALVTAAGAHETQKGPNGGMVVEASGSHVELVASGTEVVLFLTDEKERPIPSEGARNARAIVQDGGRTSTVALAPAAPNKLGGRLNEPVNAGARIVVSATLADGRSIQARFVKN